MTQDALFALWFFLPAAMANVMPILVAPLPYLRNINAPMDFGKTFRGRRILGSHKTWRGFVSGLIAATLTLWVQQILVHHFGWAQHLTHQVNYAALPTLIVGPLFCIGALGGDAIESFFKRQRGVAPGHSWFPFDQLDYIVGAALTSSLYVSLTVLQYAWLIVLWLIIQLVSCYVGWLLHLKESPI